MSAEDIEWTVALTLTGIEDAKRRWWLCTDGQIEAHKRTGSAVAMWRAKDARPS